MEGHQEDAGNDIFFSNFFFFFINLHFSPFGTRKIQRGRELQSSPPKWVCTDQCMQTHKQCKYKYKCINTSNNSCYANTITS